MCSELWGSVIAWAASKGARDLPSLDGVWHGRTERREVLGPLDVRINGHSDEVDGIPPGHVKIGMDNCFPGFIALVGVNGGMVISSPVPGEDEHALIAHFIEQTAPEFRAESHNH